jgi:TP901 family phage tail tape measure protein
MKATLALQTAFKINTDDLADSINFLNAIENQTSTTLNDLVEAIPRVGPVVKSLGGDVKDLSVLMVAMREGGIPAAEAANAIKSGMASLINPTQKASDVAKEFGINLQGIVNANQGQLMPTLFALQGALDGLDSFSKSRVIEQIFGKYQFARISALFSNLGKAGSQTEQAMRLAGASTADLAAIANKELTAYTESTTVKFKRMVETVKNQLIPMGSALLEMLTPALDKLSGIIDFMKNAFSSLPGFLKEPLKLLAGFALAAGPILMLVGLFKQLIGNGIKFGMSIVTLGAKLAGIRTDKFKLLDAETVGATAGLNALTTAASNQKVMFDGLNQELRLYIQQLASIKGQNPAMFAPPVGRTPAPRRYGNGGMTPGSGNSDTIPALLTPGEFVVKKSAAQRYRGILDAMNSGTIKGFNGGTPGQAPQPTPQVTADPTQLSHLFKARRTAASEVLQRTDLTPASRALITLMQSIHGADFEVQTFSNGVINLRKSLNQGMEKGRASLAELSVDIDSTGTAFDPLKDNLRRLVADT